MSLCVLCGGPAGSGPWSPLRKETSDVLVEVVYLLERLEADRQDAEDTLLTEKGRRKRLEKRLRGVALWKQHEHAAAVQKGQGTMSPGGFRVVLTRGEGGVERIAWQPGRPAAPD